MAQLQSRVWALKKISNQRRGEGSFGPGWFLEGNTRYSSPERRGGSSILQKIRQRDHQPGREEIFQRRRSVYEKREGKLQRAERPLSRRLRIPLKFGAPTGLFRKERETVRVT